MKPVCSFGIIVRGVLLFTVSFAGWGCSAISRTIWVELTPVGSGTTPIEVHTSVDPTFSYVLTEIDSTKVRLEAGNVGGQYMWVGPMFLPFIPKHPGSPEDITKKVHPNGLEIDISFDRESEAEVDVVIDFADCHLSVANREFANRDFLPGWARAGISKPEPFPIRSHRFLLGQKGYTIKLTFEVTSYQLRDGATLKLPEFSIGNRQVALPPLAIKVRYDKRYLAMSAEPSVVFLP